MGHDLLLTSPGGIVDIEVDGNVTSRRLYQDRHFLLSDEMRWPCDAAL